MNEEKQAARLARWVDEVLAPSDRPSAPPDDLDDDILEAIAALRPDRAPAPRLTADDILGSIESGPLARGPVVPVAATPEPANLPTLPSGGNVVALPPPAGRPRRRVWAAIGGVGGVGVLAAVAASLLLVLNPEMMKRPSPATAPAGAAAEVPAPPADLPLPVTTTETLPRQAAEQAKGIPEVPPRTVVDGHAAGITPTPPEAAKADYRAPAKPRETPAYDYATPPAPSPLAPSRAIAGGDAELKEPDDVAVESRQQAVEGGLAQQAADATRSLEDNNTAEPLEKEASGGYRDDDRSAEQAPVLAEPTDEAAHREDKRKSAEKDTQKQEDSWFGNANQAAPTAAASPPPPPPEESADTKSPRGGWMTGLDAQTVARFDEARAAADALARSGDYAAAAARLAPVVTAPARAGMYHAAIAAQYWMQAGEPENAAAIARQGLALSTADSPERRALVARLEDAVRASSPATEMDEAR